MDRNKMLNKKNIIGLIVILLLFTIPLSIVMKKQKIKKFEIQTIANMYAMIEITEQYVAEDISVLEFSDRQTKLMTEMDNVKVPKDEILDNLIYSYQTSCNLLSLSALTAAKDGENPVIAIDDSFDVMESSIDNLKNRIYIIGVENKINVDFSKDIEKEINDLLVKIQ